MPDMNPLKFNDGIEFARKLDSIDPLREYRSRFDLPEKDVIYLDGNSLGRLPVKTKDLVDNTVRQQWGSRLIRSWNEGWYDLASEIGNKLSRIIGADPGEVILSDSTSVNLFKLTWAALKAQGSRRRIVVDRLNFPSDFYIVEGIARNAGQEYEVVYAGSPDGLTTDFSALEALIDENTALVVLPHVAFKSAFMYDMERVNRMAHDHGALVLWDLSHSVGALPVQLNATGADLAVGCTYKYLNGGPGSPAFLYASNDVIDKLESPVWGWFGDDKPFSFDLEYNPAPGIRKFLVGTPPVLSLGPVSTGLDITISAGMDRIRQKSVLQSEYLIFLVKEHLVSLAFGFGSPMDASIRGSHISLQHEEAYRICQALIQPQNGGYCIIPDFREPDNIRLGITPLYTTFEELFIAVEELKKIVTGKKYLNFNMIRNAVT